MKNKRLRLARMECDMSQAQLAEAVGVTRQTIGLIESGGYNPTLNLCIAIAVRSARRSTNFFGRMNRNDGKQNGGIYDETVSEKAER